MVVEIVSIVVNWVSDGRPPFEDSRVDGPTWGTRHTRCFASPVASRVRKDGMHR
jgi:hypothetical protein